MHKNAIKKNFGGQICDAFWQNCGTSQVQSVGNTGLRESQIFFVSVFT